LTVNVWPRMDKDALRACLVLLAATSYTTTPVPVPEPPLTTVSQLSLLVALHTQSLDAFTLTFPVPPVALKD